MTSNTKLAAAFIAIVASAALAYGQQPPAINTPAIGEKSPVPSVAPAVNKITVAVTKPAMSTKPVTKTEPHAVPKSVPAPKTGNGQVYEHNAIFQPKIATKPLVVVPKTAAKIVERKRVVRHTFAPPHVFHHSVSAFPTPPTTGLSGSVFGLKTNGTTFVDVPGALDQTIQANALRQLNQSSSYQAPKLRRGSRSKKYLALTFDDGPHKTYTLQLLKILKAANAPATFFVVGKQIRKFPSLVQLEVLQGHELGNHTFNHLNLSKLSPPQIAFELDSCDKTIESLVGARTRFFRPPGGDYTNDVISAVMQRKYITSLWTCDPGDYAIPGADVLLERSIDRISPGAIYLFHDGMPETMAMLPTLIIEGRRRGYEFVTLSKMVQN